MNTNLSELLYLQAAPVGGRDFEDVKCVFAQFEASIEYSKCVVKFSHPADTKELDGSLAFVVKLRDLLQ